MKYLPFENIVYQSALNSEEIQRRLSATLVEDRRFPLDMFKTFEEDKYIGTVSANSFDVRRAINGRNSFLPQINGVVSSTLNSSTIHVKMRLHFFVIVFSVVWCTFVLFSAISAATVWLTGGDTNPALLIPLGMLLFFYLMTILSFKYESKKSKKDLKNLFEAEIIQE